jgi:hypothetical protein
VKTKRPAIRFAIRINNSEYPAPLELHKLYRVLPDEDAARDGDLRVIDESGEDYLFPSEYFVRVSLPHTNKLVLQKSFTRGLRATVA